MEDSEVNASEKEVNGSVNGSAEVGKNYDEMFPALTSTVLKPISWGKRPESYVGQQEVSGASEIFQISPKDFATSINKVREYLLQLQKEYQVKIDISTARATGFTTFVISGKSASLGRVRRLINAKITLPRESTLEVPKHLLKFIIGNKGKTLNEIRKNSLCEIKVPSKQNEPSSAEDDSTEMELVPLKIVGDKEGIDVAKNAIKDIINEKESKIVVKLEFEKIYMPFLFGFKLDAKSFGAANNGINVRISGSPSSDKHDEVVLVGDREIVNEVVQKLQKIYEEKKRTLNILSISIKKRLHKFLVGPKGQNLNEIFVSSGCMVELPSQHSPDETVIVRGPQDALVVGLQLALDKANSVSIEEIQIPQDKFGAFCYKFLTFKERPRLKKLEQDNSVQIFVSDKLIDIQGGKEDVSCVKNQLESFISEIRTFIFKDITIPHELHRFLFQKLGTESNLFKSEAIPFKQGSKPIDCLKEIGFEAIVPPTNGISMMQNLPSSVKIDDELDIVVIYSKSFDLYGSKYKSPTELMNIVDLELNSILNKMGELVNFKLNIDPKFHSRLIGYQGKGIEEMKDFVKAKNGPSAVVSIWFPRPDVEDNVEPDIVTIRGTPEDVEVCVEHLKKLVEAYKHHDFLHSHECTIPIKENIFRKLLQRGGGVIQDVNENPNVRLTVNDKNKPDFVLQLQGLKKDVEQLKDVIKSKIARFKDETIVKLTVDPKFHGILIGKGGQTIKKLTQKYDVRINFPKPNNVEDDGINVDVDMESEDAIDLVTITGYSKDVEYVKQEILDLVKWEKDHANCLGFLISKKTVKLLLTKSALILHDLKSKLGNQSSDIVEILFLDNVENVLQFEKSVYRFDKEYNYEGQGLEPDEANSLCLISGTIDAMKKFKNTVHDFDKESDSLTSCDLKVNAKNLPWWLSNNRMRLKCLMFQVVYSCDLDFLKRDNLQTPEEQENLSSWKELSTSNALFAKIEESFLKVLPPPRWKFFKNAADVTFVIRGKSDIVENFLVKFDDWNKKLCEVEVSVARNAIKNIIGSGGERISELRRLFDVEIEIPPREESATTPVKIFGTEENVSQCQFEIENIADARLKMSNNQSKDNNGIVTQRLSVARKLIRFIVGPSGTIINRIRNETKCRINIPSNQDYVELVGIPDNIKKAEKAIKEITEKQNINWINKKVQIPSNHHGILIGRGGKTIQDIRDEVFLQCPEIESPLNLDVQFHSSKPRHRGGSKPDEDDGHVTIKSKSEKALEVCEKIMMNYIKENASKNDEKKGWARIDQE